jgi:hypothetical protein
MAPEVQPEVEALSFGEPGKRKFLRLVSKGCRIS